MLGFFLAMGVGRNLTIGGMVDWGLTKTDGAKGERLVVVLTTQLQQQQQHNSQLENIGYLIRFFKWC